MWNILIKEIKRLRSLQNRGVCRTQASIYDGAFFVNILTGLPFSQ